MSDLNITGIITVRTSSSRLPNKCLKQFGNKNVIEHIIDRCKNYIIEPILCTSTDKSDDVLEEIAKDKKIRYFRGSLLNKIKRWSDCAKYFNLKIFHTVDADDPFFDGEEMRKSINYLISTNSDIITPTVSSANGGASVGYSIKANILSKLSSTLPDEEDTEYIWKYLDRIDNLKKLILPDANHSDLKMRLTLDYEEDFFLLNALRIILGENASRAEINELFKNNPDLHRINWFRNQDYLQNQNEK